MKPVVKETSIWLVVLPVAGALLGVALGQFAPEHFRRRATAQARYDRAIAGLAAADTARVGVGIRVPPDWLRSTDAQQHAEVERDLSITTVRRWLEAEAEARAALAELQPWSPDIRPWWDRRLLPDESFTVLAPLLSERRREPLKRYERGAVAPPPPAVGDGAGSPPTA